jgi:hypothetical protein
MVKRRGGFEDKGRKRIQWLEKFDCKCNGKSLSHSFSARLKRPTYKPMMIWHHFRRRAPATTNDTRDHFDRVVEDSLRRDLPIISTPHAKDHLANKGDDSFTSVFDLDTFQHMTVDIKQPSGSSPSSTSSKVPAFRVTAMPGKHVPPGILNTVNDLLGAVPPTNGWMLELGYRASAAPDSPFQSGYRIYISGDTLFVDELKEIPQRYAGQNIDLMLIHLGGTTIPGPNLPLLMVTMDAKQGVELMRLIQPDVTIPIHFDDYDVFLSNLDEFKKAVEEAGMTKKTVYLDRLDQYKFAVKG